MLWEDFLSRRSRKQKTRVVRKCLETVRKCLGDEVKAGQSPGLILTGHSKYKGYLPHSVSEWGRNCSEGKSRRRKIT